MAEVKERDRGLLALLVSPPRSCGFLDLKIVAAYREECVAEERGARVKAEQERDQAVKLLSEWRKTWLLESGELKARLRDVIEAADRLAYACAAENAQDDWKPQVTLAHQAREAALDAYRRVRDAASPEPEASKHGGRDGE